MIHRLAYTLFILYVVSLCFFITCSSSLKVHTTGESTPWQELGGDLFHRFSRGNENIFELAFIRKIKTKSIIGTSIVVGDNSIFCGTSNGYIEAFDIDTGEELDKMTIKYGVVGAPVYGNHILYFGVIAGNYTLNAYNVKDGKYVWRKKYGPVESSLTVSDNRVYAANWAGIIYCIQSTSGKELWHFQADAEIVSGLLVFNNTVYAGTIRGTIRALDADTGIKIWETETGMALRASPSSDGQRIFWGTLDNALLVLNAKTGEMEWVFKTNGSIFSTPSIVDSAVIFGCNDGFIYCLESVTGKEQWRFEVGTVVNTACITIGNRVYFGALDRKVYALNSTDGTKTWEYPVEGRVINNPAYYAGKLIIPVEHRFLYIFGEKEH